MSLYTRIIRPLLQRFSIRCSMWCRLHMSVRTRFFMVCLITCLVSGIAAWILKSLIKILSTELTSSLSNNGFNWILLAAPCGGIVLTALLQRFIFHRRITDGTEKIHSYIKSGQSLLPHQLTYEPIVGCAITVGMGGSAGAEGPVAYAGAAIGSNSSRFFSLSQEHMRVMIGIGAGTGIAAIFKAPLAGVFYTLEVLGMSMNSVSVLILVVCCLISSGLVYVLSGFHEELAIQAGLTNFNYSQTAWLLAIGIVTGLYCKWYVHSGIYTGKLCRRIKNKPALHIASGLILGLMVFCFPTMFGEGYSSMKHLLAGNSESLTSFSPFTHIHSIWVIPGILAGIIFLKGIAVTLTDKGGGIAGTFTPTLFAGCMVGGLIACAVPYIGCHIPASQIAYLCMGGAMAGIIGAPLMATFITIEVTMTYSMLIPTAIVAFTSYAVSRTNFNNIKPHKKETVNL